MKIKEEGCRQVQGSLLKVSVVVEAVSSPRFEHSRPLRRFKRIPFALVVNLVCNGNDFVFLCC